MAERLVVESCIRGYHVYKQTWTPNYSNPEVLTCIREPGNVVDPYAVAVIDSERTIVGHIPRAISAVCSLFLLRGGKMECEVRGPRRYSADLPQGGLEHPCCIIFVGHADKIRKISKLLKEAPTCELTGVSEPPAKKSKIDIVDSPKDSENTHPTWIQKHGYRLSLLDKEVLYSGDMLSDLHMNVSQAILKNQFPHVDGFNNTLLQVKQSSELEIKSGLQIVHCRGNHWILASNMSCEEGVVQLFDSIFASVDETTVRVLHTFFQFTNIQMMPFQKQLGVSDCGLFSIAAATAILFGQDPTTISFQQDRMWNHLLNCIEQGLFSLFPIQ